jgi:hypothetical protein
MALLDPPALAFATVSDQAVYDPQGEIDDTGRAIREGPVHVARLLALARLPRGRRTDTMDTA